MPNPSCLACGQTEQDVPLIRIQFRGTEHWICPRHLPVLIHDPKRLADRFPGAENLTAAEHQDHH